MTSESEEGPFYLEEVSVAGDSDDEYQYEEVPVEDEASTIDFLEDLNDAVYAIEESKQITRSFVPPADLTSSQDSGLLHRPEVIDDFVRNFFLKMGLYRTLECFQTEWYEMQQRGLLGEEDIGTVPDAYIRNQNLSDEVKRLKREVEKYKSVGSKAKEAFIKVQKQRDYHKLHHRRVVQEKNSLIEDIIRLKKHYRSYEPTLRQLKHKYELAMKEKMQTRLERDRVTGQATVLQATLRNLESGKAEPIPAVTGYRAERAVKLEGPSQRTLRKSRMAKDALRLLIESTPEKNVSAHCKDSVFPLDDCINPLLSLGYPIPSHLTTPGGLKITSTIKAHDLAISSVRIHPRKQLAVTTSDDRLWKMWSLPEGKIRMTGGGHTDWIADCDFHPEGKQLVTGGADTTLKIWDFAQASCVLTFEEHTHAVWGVTWHSCGDFIASCSMDSTSKIWDVHSERCRSTLRGHTDSVNSILFLYYSNTLLTSSADKTLSLWDARTGLCAQTFYGHMHSVNDAIFNIKGNTIASCDSYGIVKLWDTREIAPIATINVGPHPANKVAFDVTGKLLATASNDGTVKMIDLSDHQYNYISGHQEAVQAVTFDRTGQFLLSGGSDGVLQLWS